MKQQEIEAKKLQLKQLKEEANAIYKELVEVGAIELSDDDLAKATGGATWNELYKKLKEKKKQNQ